METKTIKERIEELRIIDCPYSDIQGIAGAISLDSGIDEEEILKYANGKIEINEVEGLI